MTHIASTRILPRRRRSHDPLSDNSHDLVVEFRLKFQRLHELQQNLRHDGRRRPGK